MSASDMPFSINGVKRKMRRRKLLFLIIMSTSAIVMLVGCGKEKGLQKTTGNIVTEGPINTETPAKSIESIQEAADEENVSEGHTTEKKINKNTTVSKNDSNHKSNTKIQDKKDYAQIFGNKKPQNQQEEKVNEGASTTETSLDNADENSQDTMASQYSDISKTTKTPKSTTKPKASEKPKVSDVPKSTKKPKVTDTPVPENKDGDMTEGEKAPYDDLDWGALTPVN